MLPIFAFIRFSQSYVAINSSISSIIIIELIMSVPRKCNEREYERLKNIGAQIEANYGTLRGQSSQLKEVMQRLEGFKEIFEQLYEEINQKVLKMLQEFVKEIKSFSDQIKEFNMKNKNYFQIYEKEILLVCEFIGPHLSQYFATNVQDYIVSLLKQKKFNQSIIDYGKSQSLKTLISKIGLTAFNSTVKSVLEKLQGSDEGKFIENKILQALDHRFESQRRTKQNQIYLKHTSNIYNKLSSSDVLIGVARDLYQKGLMQAGDKIMESLNMNAIFNVMKSELQNIQEKAKQNIELKDENDKKVAQIENQWTPLSKDQYLNKYQVALQQE